MKTNNNTCGRQMTRMSQVFTTKQTNNVNTSTLLEGTGKKVQKTLTFQLTLGQAQILVHE